MPVTPGQPVHGFATLVLLIRRGDGPATPYTVRRLWEHPAIPGPAYRLTKADGTVIDVALTGHGPTCTCQDATYRERECKHARSLKAVGLLRRGG